MEIHFYCQTVKVEEHSHDAVKICFIHRGGFVINDPEFRLGLHRIRASKNSIVLKWLGTCESTTKDSQSKTTISCGTDIDKVVLDYEKFKESIISFKITAKVFFIETPIPYINVWNVNHGHDVDDSLDQGLHDILESFYVKLLELNSVRTPSISQDLIQS